MTKYQRLETVAKSFQAFSHRLPLEIIDHAYVTGSLARGIYYLGWSDVDIVFVFNRPPAVEHLQMINSWKAELGKLFPCKIGLDYLSVDMLTRAIKSRHPEDGLSFLHAYHIDQRDALAKGLLVGDLTTLPKLPRSLFMNLDMLPRIEAVQIVIYELFMRNSIDCFDVTMYRTLVKSTLYLAQTLYLHDEGKMLCDYPALISLMHDKYELPVQALRETFASLDAGVDIATVITPERVKNVMKTFQELEVGIANAISEPYS